MTTTAQDKVLDRLCARHGDLVVEPLEYGDVYVRAMGSSRCWIVGDDGQIMERGSR